jgi:hypothetical protein
MDLFAQIEKSIDDKIAALQHLNQRLRYNKLILSKTIQEKVEFHANINVSNPIENSSIPPTKSTDVVPNDLIENDSEEVTLESKLDMILSLAKSTRVAAASAKNESHKERDHNRNSHSTKGALNKASSKQIPDTASISSQQSTRKDIRIPLSNAKNTTQIEPPSHPAGQNTDKNVKEGKVIPKQPEFPSAIVEQLNFLSRNRIYNRFKSHFVTIQKVSQVQSLISEKVISLNFLCPSPCTLFQLMSYLLSMPKLRQLVTKLRHMKSNNKFYMDEIITLVVLQARPIVQKLSKQSLLAKTSLGLDDTMLLEHWLMGQVLLGITSFVLNNCYRSSSGQNNLLWQEFQNCVLMRTSIGYMLKNDEITLKLRGKMLVELLSKNMEYVLKLISRTKLHEVVLNLKLACKDIVRNRIATHNSDWKEFLVCYRVISSIVLDNGKKINCSILNKPMIKQNS